MECYGDKECERMQLMEAILDSELSDEGRRLKRYEELLWKSLYESKDHETMVEFVQEFVESKSMGKMLRIKKNRLALSFLERWKIVEETTEDDEEERNVMRTIGLL